MDAKPRMLSFIVSCSGITMILNSDNILMEALGLLLVGFSSVLLQD